MTYVQIEPWSPGDQVLSQKLNRMVENIDSVTHYFGMYDYIQQHLRRGWGGEDLNYLALSAEISINDGDFTECGTSWRFKHYDDDYGPGEYDSQLELNGAVLWPEYDLSRLDVIDGDKITMRLKVRLWEDIPGDWDTWPPWGGDTFKTLDFTFYKNSMIDTIQYQYRFTINNSLSFHPWEFTSYMKYFKGE